MQDPPAVWSQQADPNQWASTYYGYGYDAYGYAQDPSYAYGAYAGYSQYPQQVSILIQITIIIFLGGSFSAVHLCICL